MCHICYCFCQLYHKKNFMMLIIFKYRLKMWNNINVKYWTCSVILFILPATILLSVTFKIRVINNYICKKFEYNQYNFLYQCFIYVYFRLK